MQSLCKSEKDTRNKPAAPSPALLEQFAGIANSAADKSSDDMDARDTGTAWCQRMGCKCSRVIEHVGVFCVDVLHALEQQQYRRCIGRSP